MKRPFSLLALAALASACASVPMAPPERDLAAKQFLPTPGKANLYVFRDETFGAAVKMSLVLDGRMFGDTAARTFLLTTVDPGRHVLVSKAENDARLEFDAAPGANVFVWQEVKMGVLMARSKLHLIDEASGRERVNSCKLAIGEFPLPPLPAPGPQAPAVPGS
ncbi:MAG TPA: hypothetical protein VLS93_12015 [Anaeromyxobacteraceae bacterium]|nr:hypothetical protein [Anaeromyxobacteraceae bacterium]